MRALRFLLAGAFLAALAAGGVGYRAYRAEADDEGSRAPAPPPPSPSIRVLVIGDTAAWYVPSRNGAAIIYVHGWGASRDQAWPEASDAVANGFGALLIDLPTLDARRGVDWASRAVGAVEAGVEFLAAQPGVLHLGGQAFSSGCAVLLQAAARDRRLAAIALLSPYASAREHLDYEYRRWGIIAQWPARAGARRAGYRVEELDSRRAAAMLAGRPLLVIAGSEDQIIPSAMSKALFDAAFEPKQLWLVPGAGHGDFGSLLKERYLAGLHEFFDRALLQR